MKEETANFREEENAQTYAEGVWFANNPQVKVKGIHFDDDENSETEGLYIVTMEVSSDHVEPEGGAPFEILSD